MNIVTKERKETFFTHDSAFYKTLFRMLLVVALQNLVAYSVNMVDNIMLGRYSEEALSGAATVNQIFFMVQQFALSIGNALVVLASQYWGEQKKEPIRALTGIALKLGLLISAIILVICIAIPEPLLRLFTNSPSYIAEGKEYLSIVQWSFVLFILTNVLMAALRSIGVVNISFFVSVISLVINVGINYTLIFGHFGMPRMGVRGAAIGTLIARVIEFVIVLFYILFWEKKLCFFSAGFFEKNRKLRDDYTKVYLPIMCSQVLWGISVPLQTAILGKISDIAISANSVATTFYQYLKVIVIAMSSTSSVMIGNAIGRGERERVRKEARTLACIDVGIGIILGILIYVLRQPLLLVYSELSQETVQLAEHLMIIMSIVMVGMSYQMPVSFGIIQGGGDTKFTMTMNMISTWLIVMPLSLAAAFWWKWPVEAVVLVIQSDQIFKGLPTFLRFRSYKWIKKLTG